MITRSFYDEIYRMKYTIHIPKTKKDAALLTKRYNGITIEFGGAVTWTWLVDGVLEIHISLQNGCLTKPNKLLRYITHEAFHASTMALANVGAVLSHDTQEQFAYYNEYVFSEIMRLVTGKRL